MSDQQNETQPDPDRSRAEEAREPDEQPSTASATTTGTGSQVESRVETGSAAEASRQTAADESRRTVAGETDEQTRPEWVQYDFDGESKLSVHDLDVYYGDEHALKGVSMEIPEKSVTALIGPSGCGKSTYLRCLNRMNDRIKAARIDGSVELDGQNVYDDNANLVELRKRVGMVFQSPNPFPKSIRDNISYGPRKHGDINTGLLSRLMGRSDREAEDELVERSLRNAALWDEVSGRLDDNALGLSGGQQQRLCIARCLATDPEVILMDEPASALDPIATSKIEDLITDLAEDYTVVVVTHNMQQAARISDQTAVFLTGGELVEYDDTDKIFEDPESQRVEDYISGKFG